MKTFSIKHAHIEHHMHLHLQQFKEGQTEITNHHKKIFKKSALSYTHARVPVSTRQQLFKRWQPRDSDNTSVSRHPFFKKKN